MLLRPPTSPLFPYTTLFRSQPPLPRLGRRAPRHLGPLLGAPPGRARPDLPPPGAGRLTGQHHHLHLPRPPPRVRSEEHTSELQSRFDLVCRLLLEKKNQSLTKMNYRLNALQKSPPNVSMPTPISSSSIPHRLPASTTNLCKLYYAASARPHTSWS